MIGRFNGSLTESLPVQLSWVGAGRRTLRLAFMRSGFFCLLLQRRFRAEGAGKLASHVYLAIRLLLLRLAQQGTHGP